MPSFVYMARDKNGVLQTGALDGVNEEDVVTVLQSRGLIVTSVMRKESQVSQAAGQLRRVRRLRSRVSTDDNVLFCQQLATLLEAGIPLLRGLEVICAQVESRPLLVALEQMRQDIEGGRTFRDAMAKQPKIFSGLWVNLVETGEASGHLAQSLRQLSRYLESARQLQSKAMTALTYPAVLIGASILAIVIFLLKIIPMFNNLFTSMNVKLPLLTQIIINMSDVVRHYVIVVAAGVAVTIWIVRRLVRTPQGRGVVDRMLLKLPVLSPLIVNLQLAQFASGLGTLLESGVPILFSLEIVESSASNKVYGQAIGEVKERVREGKTMAEPMSRMELFPPMMVQMVQVGEEIGELGKMLEQIAAYYEARVTVFIERMTVLFEPIAIMVMGAVIGTLVVSMFLPIFSLAGGLGPGQQ
ncbi:MAG: type II secretion system F family protein [Candidatus Omnitrophica bacterium]|nr:type II secretion system F family protein [Candidatus Omnitrophota bacterium]